MNRNTPLIVGNWKMYKTASEAASFIKALVPHVTDQSKKIFIAPPFTALESSLNAAQGSCLVIGAQNMHEGVEGAFTGEISARMLKALGAEFVILGHSERRLYFHETNPSIHKKTKSALAEGLIPIVCVGETLEEREEGKANFVIQEQLKECLTTLTPTEMNQVVLAYEPVWAIGTGKTATPEIAQEIHHMIRMWLKTTYGEELACALHLLYGGSVKPQTVSSLLNQSDIDGVLVGGASLDVETFKAIIKGIP